MRLRTLWFSLFLIGMQGMAVAKPPMVLASIPPLYSLVAAVMDGVAVPELLLNGTVSPHVYALKPSEQRRLGAADMVVWVGPEYEHFLAKPMTGRGQKSLTFLEASGVKKLDQRQSCGQGCDHHHGATDPHAWLNPQNAGAFAVALCARLALQDPENKIKYERNLKVLLTDLDALDAELEQTLAPVRARGYMVFHDGYQYFENAYNLLFLGALHIDPEIPLSAKHMISLRKKIRAGDVACLFSEPQFGTKALESLKENGVRLGALDPFAGDLPLSKDTYQQMMRRLAASFKQGLEVSLND